MPRLYKSTSPARNWLMTPNKNLRGLPPHYPTNRRDLHATLAKKAAVPLSNRSRSLDGLLETPEMNEYQTNTQSCDNLDEAKTTPEPTTEVVSDTTITPVDKANGVEVSTGIAKEGLFSLKAPPTARTNKPSSPSFLPKRISSDKPDSEKIASEISQSSLPPISNASAANEVNASSEIHLPKIPHASGVVNSKRTGTNPKAPAKIPHAPERTATKKLVAKSSFTPTSKPHSPKRNSSGDNSKSPSPNVPHAQKRNDRNSTVEENPMNSHSDANQTLKVPSVSEPTNHKTERISHSKSASPKRLTPSDGKPPLPEQTPKKSPSPNSTPSPFTFEATSEPSTSPMLTPRTPLTAEDDCDTKPPAADDADKCSMVSTHSSSSESKRKRNFMDKCVNKVRSLIKK